MTDTDNDAALHEAIITALIMVVANSAAMIAEGMNPHDTVRGLPDDLLAFLCQVRADLVLDPQSVNVNDRRYLEKGAPLYDESRQFFDACAKEALKRTLKLPPA